MSVYISRTSVLVGCIILMLTFIQTDSQLLPVSMVAVYMGFVWGLYEIYMPSISRQHDGQVDWKFV